MLNFMLISAVDFFVCDTMGFLRVMYLIRVAMNLIRFIVPMLVVIMTIMDLLKNVINPKEKDGMKKIINRVVAAIIVFIIPTLVSVIVDLINKVFENGDNTNYKISSCYINAKKECIDNIESYLNCDEEKDPESNKKCQEFRRCNSYSLTSDGNCSISTSFDDYNCKKYNEDATYYKYSAIKYKYSKNK